MKSPEQLPACAVGPCAEPRIDGTFYCGRHQPRPGSPLAAATGAPIRPPQYDKRTGHITAVVASLIVIGVVIALVAANHKDGTGKSAGPAGPHGAGFVAKVQQNAKATASATTQLIAEIAVAGVDEPDLEQIASDAKDLHDNLSDWRDDLLAAASASDNDQVAMWSAENDLKNSAGSILTWAGDPNAKTSVEWQDQMASAIVHWNTAVTKIWSRADAGSPPIITVPK